jgi:polyribonucleotide nucleotidyltransferase
MFHIVRKSIEWAGRTLTLETGRMARQADGSVLVSYGDTQILCTVVAEKKQKPDIDFFPLTVNYLEKTYAAGKIPGGFFKRETKPSERETLISRLIDRPIRPMFHEYFRNETQVICTVISHDMENSPDIPALVGASAALTLSGVPFLGPIAGARVGYIDGQFVLNPYISQALDSQLDLVVAGTRSSVLMVESEAQELPEDVMLDAVMFGHKGMQPVLDLIIQLAEAAAKEPWDVTQAPYTKEQLQWVREQTEAGFREAYAKPSKQDRKNTIDAVKAPVEATLLEQGVSPTTIREMVKKIEKDIVRNDLLDTGKRIDGRDNKTVRPIAIEVGILPRAHGSALFTRGETQSLGVVTLGNAQDEQIIDTIEGEGRDRFMLHYNFPPFSVGEVGFLRAPGRREIGHGKLARRAVEPLLPSKEAFPYTMRAVSEITESNGSSSMATVCSTSLAMMDAGVPMKRPVSGIAMGLIKEGDRFLVLSDILGDEDHLGDMDFKVAGTEAGLTALQMDIKINGITEEIMRVAVTQARDGRLHILNEMNRVMNTAREEISDFAPKISSITVPKDKIREIIGTGGSVIRELCAVTGTKIDIDDDGTVNIFAANTAQAEDALNRIKAIVCEPEVGTLYEGPITRILEFGALVQFMPGRDGMIHISEMANERVEQVTDVVHEGQIVKVKLLEVERGKYRLSMRSVDQATGEDLSLREGYRHAAPRRSSGGDRDRGGRDNRGDRDERPRRRAS